MPSLISSLSAFLRGAKSFMLESSLEAFPIRRALRRYSVWKLKHDLGAGLNVALLAIPQGMAYAMIAGIDVAHGITCAAVAAIVAPLFASSRHTIMGPTNASALMLFSVLATRNISGMPQLIPLLIFMAGIMLVVAAYLRMADMIQYISRTVVVGYMTGAGLLIMAGQFREVLGIPAAAAAPASGSARTFFSMAGETLHRLAETQWPTVILSAATVIVYLALQRLGRRLPAFALTLVVMSAVTAAVQASGYCRDVAHLSGFNVSQLAPLAPDFRNRQAWDHVALLFGPAMALAFLCALENSVMSRSLASKTGDRPDANQDLLSVGLANLAAAFLSRMPASGSLLRSSLNYESGAASQMASLFSGVLCAIGALTLGAVVPCVPKCSLAVLIIAVAVSLINRRNLRICLRATKSDATTLIVTCLATLTLPLHVAIFLGVATAIVLYLRKAARPMLVEYEFNQEGELMERDHQRERQIPQISIVHVEGELFFGAAELFRTQIQRTVTDPNLRVIILRMKNARHLDATSVMALEELVRFLNSKNRHLIISGASKEVYRVLRNSGMIDVIGRENFFMGSARNPNVSTRNALKRAQELLGTKEAEIRIFYDPNRPQEG
jgi:SulP family sulfate permease